MLQSGAAQRLILVGGKGGVGKTSSSSAIAVRLADTGLSTLIVSTDPAHSLSDALMQDVSGGSPVGVAGCENLQAMEVETADAVDRFRAAVSGFRAADLGLGGLAEEVLGQLGLDEFADILDNVPPGLDELLALAETLAVVRGAEPDSDGAASLTGFERVVFDTAPTGHTLRLLAFPEFLDSLLGKVVALKARLLAAIGLLKGVLGGNDPTDKIEAAVARLQRWRDRVASLRELLTDEDVTDFVVVGIPSRLAVAECARLLSALADQGVPVSHLIVNQGRELKRLDGSSPLGELALSRLPFFDLEMRGVFPLQYVASQAFRGTNADAWEDLLADQKDRFVLVGGKGGVGKTTTSASLAVQFATDGHSTLLVSTDPAHSLGDALETDLSSGEVVRVEGVAGASLYACEVKVDDAVAEFKRLVGGVSSDEGGAASAQGLGLSDFADIFDAVPPGVDELIALSKIVALAQRDAYGIHFDRVVIDTAPTGHTLRLLTFPDFLDRFITRLLVLRSRFDGAANMLGGAQQLLGKLKEFQAQMQALQALLHDPETTEFCIVTIATALSLNEAERLLLELRREGIAVRRGVVNRLIATDVADGYVARLANGQRQCLAELDDLAARCAVDVTQVPYFDTELRSVYGLRAMGNALFDAPPPSSS
ncbi:hypothetical protein EMIHUDRAFT_224177 [Emiliania huxleyi CCMP1516]|uniref:ArsA/GET3 Anion-transporting ATPase-like domain-containing protein n=4 Tax=Emiliania huxleyi TaxID=2903 RepID=A0A0D3KSN4_EMIH1|nr:hypothetical protein EMIHUDRAFT_224177 [Emiliania huxleyi CCMP1516]EOD38769.1 hypothetical protein EMIHUDRAFT_224177 [Emiliania huxleyi CCMP1516]|eukprot:XP_005791198.1 hypothetical protein EMIHUDRAFT_224177 [Emiliania huxleyi CCMP1516]